jgi:hypothetical protein
VIKISVFLFKKHRTMAMIPTDPDCMWSYSFCELIDFGVEIDDDWYSVGNIDHDDLDDLQGDYPHLFEDEATEVPTNGWDEITHEVTEHKNDEALDMR